MRPIVAVARLLIKEFQFAGLRINGISTHAVTITVRRIQKPLTMAERHIARIGDGLECFDQRPRAC